MVNRRNEQGWRIPRTGTVARKVYDLLLEGGNRHTIGAAVGRTPANVAVVIYYIKHPDVKNRYEAVWLARHPNYQKKPWVCKEPEVYKLARQASVSVERAREMLAELKQKEIRLAAAKLNKG